MEGANRGTILVELKKDSPRLEWLQPHWKDLPVRWGHPWHAMCSYLAMFPPSLPRYFIEQCTRIGDIVFDPFAGRGTTPLEACLAGRIGIGTDANPLAVLLTGAKVNPPRIDNVRDRVESLRCRYRRAVVNRVAPPEIRMLFDGRRTLPQLLFIRAEIDKRSSVDRFLLATLCGILHGNHTQDPRASGSLSISMPNTFAMSPGYIARYIQKHHLRKYPFDVFDALQRRLNRLDRQPPPPVRGSVARLDVKKIDDWMQSGSASLVVTSPPYLKVVRYGKYNWIRLWLLNEVVEEVDSRLRVEATDTRLRLSDRLRLPAYTSFIGDSIRRCERVLKPGGLAAFVIGDVDTPDGEHINLAQHVWSQIRRETKFQHVDIMADPLDVGGKVTRIWGSRRGNATKVDRILVLKKSGAGRYRVQRPSQVISYLRDADHPFRLLMTSISPAKLSRM